MNFDTRSNGARASSCSCTSVRDGSPPPRAPRVSPRVARPGSPQRFLSAWHAASGTFPTSCKLRAAMARFVVAHRLNATDGGGGGGGGGGGWDASEVGEWRGMAWRIRISSLCREMAWGIRIWIWLLLRPRN